MPEEDWQALGFIKASSYRKKIVEELESANKTPSKLSDSCEIRISHVSSTLSELQSKNIVKCLNPEMRKGKIYSLTDKGKWAARNIG